MISTLRAFDEMLESLFQVAHALHCPTTTDSDLAICLRGQDVDTLLNVKIHKPNYVPAFAPLIDNAVIPDKPYNLMKNPQMFDRYIAGYMLRQIVYLLLDEKLFQKSLVSRTIDAFLRIFSLMIYPQRSSLFINEINKNGKIFIYICTV